MFSLQALYLAYFSGQGFHWPLLSIARPISSYAWNVPVAISAAAASLFVREFANLRLFSPKVYQAFGWLAVARHPGIEWLSRFEPRRQHEDRVLRAAELWDDRRRGQGEALTMVPGEDLDTLIDAGTGEHHGNDAGIASARLERWQPEP